MNDMIGLEETCTLYYQLITGYRVHSISIASASKDAPNAHYVTIHMFQHMRFGIEFEVHMASPDSFPPMHNEINTILARMMEILGKCGMSNNVSLWKRAKAWFYYKRHMENLRV